VPHSFENALFQWEEGGRRLEELGEDRQAQRPAQRILAALQDELRRRIGPTFTAAELAELYAEGTDWCTEVAFRTGAPPSVEPQELADAAFWLYLRGARDYAGGRHLVA
jgi:hypothetical protein